LMADGDGGKAALFDPPAESSRYMPLVKRHGLEVVYIFATHGHGDHTWGIADTVKITGGKVVAFKDSHIDAAVRVGDGDTLELGSVTLTIIHTPGENNIQLLPGGKTASNSFSQVKGASIFCSRAIPLATPRTNNKVPRVTINGGSFTFDIIIPLRRPKRAPTRIPAIIENIILNFAPKRRAMMIPTNEISEPTERSIPFVSMTSDIPKPIIANGLLCNKILVIFIVLKNCGAVMEKTIRMTTNNGMTLGILKAFLSITCFSGFFKSPPTNEMGVI